MSTFNTYVHKSGALPVHYISGNIESTRFNCDPHWAIFDIMESIMYLYDNATALVNFSKYMFINSLSKYQQVFVNHLPSVDYL